MWHKDTTSCSSPEPSEGSWASLPSFSQGTKVEGRRPRLGTGRSSEVWLSVSFRAVWAASGGASCTSRPAGGTGRSGSAGPLPSPRGFSLFSSVRLNRDSLKAPEDARFLGEGGRCRPWTALSSCPRCHSAWSPEAPQSRARLFSLGALGLFCKRNDAFRKNSIKLEQLQQDFLHVEMERLGLDGPPEEMWQQQPEPSAPTVLQGGCRVPRPCTCDPEKSS